MTSFWIIIISLIVLWIGSIFVKCCSSIYKSLIISIVYSSITTYLMIVCLAVFIVSDFSQLEFIFNVASIQTYSCTKRQSSIFVFVTCLVFVYF